MKRPPRSGRRRTLHANFPKRCLTLISFFRCRQPSCAICSFKEAVTICPQRFVNFPGYCRRKNCMIIFQRHPLATLKWYDHTSCGRLFCEKVCCPGKGGRWQLKPSKTRSKVFAGMDSGMRRFLPHTMPRRFWVLWRLGLCIRESGSSTAFLKGRKARKSSVALRAGLIMNTEA